MRRCVLTRASLPKEHMFRFAVSPDGALVPDLAGKLPGRGIWLSAHADVIEGLRGSSQVGTEPKPERESGSPAPRRGSTPAKTRDLVRAIARAARGPVRIAPDLHVTMEMALVRRIGELIGLARRAGQAIAGFEKARDWMRTHPTGLVLQASDGSGAERARFLSAVPDRVPLAAPLTGAELGRIFGHDHVVHVAIAAGKLAEALTREAFRLAALRTPETNPLEEAPMGQGPMGQGPAGQPPVQAPPVTAGTNSMLSHGATGRETATNNDATGTNG